MDELKSAWSAVKTTLEEQENEAIKLDLSITELEKVVKEENADLIEIKGKITLTNIEALQKLLQEKSD
jgi:hypothetical protein